MIPEIIIAVTGITVLMLITPNIVEQSNTIKIFEKRCTLDSLASYNITYTASCPTEQVTIEDWDSINESDKTEIEFILSSNGYEQSSTNTIYTEIIRDSMNNTEVVK